MSGAGDAAYLQAATLWQLIQRRADATPDALFAIDERERSLSFAGYRDAVLRAAAGLQELGVEPGVAVSWSLPNRLESLVLAGALARLGAVQNPILPIYREREFGFVTRQTGARLLIVPSRFRGFDYSAMASELAAQQPQLAPCVIDGALPEADPDALRVAEPELLAPDALPVRWIYYTSGTTADPKGAQHTDATLLSHALGMARGFGCRAGDRSALVFPFTHVGGASWLFAGLAAGVGHVVIESFDPPRTLPVLARNGVVLAGAGTAFHQAYLAAQRAQPETPVLPDVRCFPGGGAAKPPELHYEMKRELGGVGIVSGYGLTECPIIAMCSVEDPDEKLAHTEGRVSPAGAEIRVLKSDGARAAPGEEGELRVRGPQLCKGYVDSTLDSAAFDEHGFFRTGDLGRLDADGYVTITGRLKDVIVRKGENISAKELEDLLYAHPKVSDVAVIGLPDPALGERCCAVVASAAEPLAFDEMVEYLKQAGLMRQKIPEQLELVSELPRNPSGKVLKNELRARYAQ